MPNEALSLSGQQAASQKGSMARRRYQKGSLFLRGKRTKVWVGRWRDYELVNGETRAVNRKEILGTLAEYPTKRLAQRALEQRLSLVNVENTSPRQVISFADFANRWQQNILTQYKDSTRYEMGNQLKVRIRPEFDNLNLRDITTERIQRWVASLVGVVSPIRIHNLVWTLRAMWRAAKAWGYVQHDPFPALVLPKARKPEPRCFSLDEVQRILTAAPEPLRTFLWLAAETGMRGGELCGLRKEDVDCEKGIVRVRQRVWRGRADSPKTSAGTRQFAISDALAARINEYLLSGGDGVGVSYVFATSKGTPWTSNKIVHYQLRPLLASLGIAHGGLHAFRHFQATELDRRNVSVRSQLARMGHSTLLSNRRYGRAVAADDVAFADELGKDLCPTAPINENGLTPVQSQAA